MLTSTTHAPYLYAWGTSVYRPVLVEVAYLYTIGGFPGYMSHTPPSDGLEGLKLFPVADAHVFCVLVQLQRPPRLELLRLRWVERHPSEASTTSHIHLI